jgi:hypothetical protein
MKMGKAIKSLTSLATELILCSLKVSLDIKIVCVFFFFLCSSTSLHSPNTQLSSTLIANLTECDVYREIIFIVVS